MQKLQRRRSLSQSAPPPNARGSRVIIETANDRTSFSSQNRRRLEMRGAAQRKQAAENRHQRGQPQYDGEQNHPRRARHAEYALSQRSREQYAKQIARRAAHDGEQ